MVSVGNRWRKSSYSGGNGGECVEVGQDHAVVMVRDTKANGTGPALAFTPGAWVRFTMMVKTEE